MIWFTEQEFKDNVKKGNGLKGSDCYKCYVNWCNYIDYQTKGE